MPAGEDLERRATNGHYGRTPVPPPFAHRRPGQIPLPSLPVRWVLGFFLCGSLFGMIGALMVAWRYYMGQDSRLIGLHFLALDGGMLAAHLVARRYVNQGSVRWAMITGSLLSAAGLVALSFVLPPAPMAFRLTGLVVTGAGAGVIFSGLFSLIRPFQQSS